MYRLLWMSTHPHAWDAATVALSALTMVLVLRGRALLGRAARLASGGRVTQPIAGLEVVLATVVGACAAALFGCSCVCLGSGGGGSSEEGCAGLRAAVRGLPHRPRRDAHARA